MKKLTEQQFNKAVSQTRMHSKTKNIAKEALVEQKSKVKIAEKYDVHRQFVESSAKKIYDIHLTNISAPKDWVEICAFFPAKRGKEVEKEAKKLLLDHNKKLKAKK